MEKKLMCIQQNKRLMLLRSVQKLFIGWLQTGLCPDFKGFSKYGYPLNLLKTSSAPVLAIIKTALSSYSLLLAEKDHV